MASGELTGFDLDRATLARSGRREGREIRFLCPTATGFPLAVPDQVPVTRTPTAAELDLIRTRLDPGATREREIP